jgi:DNA-binding transcriptional LysR family regulator
MVVGHDSLLPVSSLNQAGEPLHSLHASTAKTPLKLLSYSAESGIGGMVSEIQAAVVSRFPTQVMFTAHLASVLRTMAIDGRGMAWLPRTLIADDLANGVLVVAAGLEWQLPLDVKLYRDKAVMSPAGEAFWVANTIQCSQLNPVI